MCEYNIHQSMLYTPCQQYPMTITKRSTTNKRTQLHKPTHAQRNIEQTIKTFVNYFLPLSNALEWNRRGRTNQFHLPIEIRNIYPVIKSTTTRTNPIQGRIVCLCRNPFNSNALLRKPALLCLTMSPTTRHLLHTLCQIKRVLF